MTSDSLTPDYRNRIAFVILSCDKYSDLWDICVDRLRRHWPDIPMDIYMIANYKRCEHPGVTTLLVGDDKDWSSTVRAAITQLVQPYVFFWFEDALLDQDINNENILYDEKTFTKNGCHFCPSNMLGQGRQFDKEIFEEKTKNMIFCIVSNIDFPNIKVRFVKGSELIVKYNKGFIPLNHFGEFFD